MDEAEERTPEEDAAIARHALDDEGDAKHAAFHVAWALTGDPSRREWLALLDRAIAAVPDPLALAPMDDEGEISFAVAAVRAYILAHLGRFGEAIPLLLRVYPARPDVPYLGWAVAWLGRPGVAGAIDLGGLNAGLALLVKQVPDALPEGRRRAFLGAMLPFAEALRTHRDRIAPKPGWRRFLPSSRKVSREAQGMFLFLLSAIFRKLGHLDVAFELASEGYRRHPFPPTAIALAMACRARGDIEAAITYYRAAAKADPKDTSALADAAWTLWEAGRRDEAERTYGEALARDPVDPKSLPNYCYLRYISSKFDRAWLDKLRDYVDAHPDDEHARGLLRRLTPYLGLPPSPGDAQVNILRQFAEKKAADPSWEYPTITRYTSSDLEAPSGRIAHALMTGTLGRAPLIACEVEQVAEPDPRLPRRPVPYQLWRYEGTMPIPVVPPPEAEVAAAVAAIAARPYDFEEWGANAGAIGARFGPDRVDDFLGAMAHPTPPPDGIDPWDWVARLQVAAAMAIAGIDGIDAGWEGTLRRKVLLALLDGPLDWSVSAAAVALTFVALEMPDAVEEVHEALIQRLKSRPDKGDVCYVLPVVHCLLELPDTAGPERTALRELGRTYED